MKNVQMMVEGNTLIRAVLVRKNYHHASTEGSVSVLDREEKIGLNVYRKK